MNLCNTDLSSFYFEIVKDRLYADEGMKRQSCQYVLYHALKLIMTTLAPIACHTSQDIFNHLPKANGNQKNLYSENWNQLTVIYIYYICR